MNLPLSTKRSIFVAAVMAVPLILAGCDHLPGKPAPGPEVPIPSAELDFNKLYAQNCSGCHGDNGQHGAAIALNNPTYLALVDEATLKNVTTSGYKDGLMPGFGAKAGGMLTGEQIDAIVSGMRAQWGKGNVLAGLNAPSYASSKKGDAAHGAEVYASVCARCHGAAGTGTQKSSILNGSYLGLMNEQSLRTIAIVGRPELGMPDWRGGVAGHPLTDDDVTNVVAWLQAQTPGYPGQPYSSSPAASRTDSSTKGGKE